MDPRRVNAWVDLALFALLAGLMVKRWVESPEGQIAKARLARWWEEQTAGCEGCQHRKERLVKLRNRILFDAQRAVEGEDIETVADVVDRDLGPSGV